MKSYDKCLNTRRSNKSHDWQWSWKYFILLQQVIINSSDCPWIKGGVKGIVFFFNSFSEISSVSCLKANFIISSAFTELYRNSVKPYKYPTQTSMLLKVSDWQCRLPGNCKSQEQHHKNAHWNHLTTMEMKILQL